MKKNIKKKSKSWIKILSWRETSKQTKSLTQKGRFPLNKHRKTERKRETTRIW